jgi:PAP2 superfamily
MLAYAAIWIVLGAILAYAFPAAGPAFYAVLADPAGAAPFTAVHDRLVATGGSEAFLTSLGNQAYLLRNLDAPVLVVGGGISAIPSVHNAMAALFALASFRVSRLVGLAMTAFAVTIWIASVYLNWHYAIDGILGAAGAVALWFLAGKVVDRVLAPPKTEPEPVAAPA